MPDYLDWVVAGRVPLGQAMPSPLMERLPRPFEHSPTYLLNHDLLMNCQYDRPEAALVPTTGLDVRKSSHSTAGTVRLITLSSVRQRKCQEANPICSNPPGQTGL